MVKIEINKEELGLITLIVILIVTLFITSKVNSNLSLKEFKTTENNNDIKLVQPTNMLRDNDISTGDHKSINIDKAVFDNYITLQSEFENTKVNLGFEESRSLLYALTQKKIENLKYVSNNIETIKSYLINNKDYKSEIYNEVLEDYVLTQYYVNADLATSSIGVYEEWCKTDYCFQSPLTIDIGHRPNGDILVVIKDNIMSGNMIWSGKVYNININDSINVIEITNSVYTKDGKQINDFDLTHWEYSSSTDTLRVNNSVYVPEPDNTKICTQLSTYNIYRDKLILESEAVPICNNKFN